MNQPEVKKIVPSSAREALFWGYAISGGGAMLAGLALGALLVDRAIPPIASLWVLYAAFAVGIAGRLIKDQDTSQTARELGKVLALAFGFLVSTSGWF